MSTSLTVVERAKQALAATKSEADLKALAEKSVTITVITNADGYQQVHSARMSLKNMRVEVRNFCKEVREEATKFGKAVIAEEDRLIALIEPEEKRLAKLQDKWDADREAEEQEKINAEVRRVQDLQERVAYLRGNQTLSSMNDPALLAEHISDLESEIVDNSFQEFQQQAADAKAAGLARLNQLHTASLKRVEEEAHIKAERAELERLRAEQTQREAAERARLAEEERTAKAARDAETAKQAAELAAERKRIAEEEKIAKAAREADAKKLADERAAFEREQSEARRRREIEEAERTEQARIAALTKPSDDELIGVLCRHYRAPESKVIEWLHAITFEKAAA